MTSLQHTSVREVGLTVLWQPHGLEATIDVVFVHGFNGHPRNTWADANTNFFWPWELRNELPTARILTFGYDARIETKASKNLMDIHDYGNNLLLRLRNERAAGPNGATARPLAFVCHSLGGLVVKEALISAQGDPNFRGIYLVTKAIMFFGTPHRGSQALSQKRLGLLMNIAQLTFTEIPPNIIRALELRSRDLFTINDRFRNIGLVEDKLLSIISFYERRETAVLHDVVVDQDSAALGYPGEEAIGLPLDHRGLVRYKSKDDDHYDIATKTLKAKLKVPPPSRPTIPYLTMTDWSNSIVLYGQSFRGKLEVGVERLGEYTETWRNLLDLFGAESIARSDQASRIPINLDEMPQGSTNVQFLALELECAAVLAGLAGCNTMDITEESIRIQGKSSCLELTRGGPFSMIGRYTQEIGTPTYLSNSPRDIAMATFTGSGPLLYRIGDITPMSVTTELTRPGNEWLFPDLNSSRCMCDHTITIGYAHQAGLCIPAVGLLAADTPTSIRVYPFEKFKIREAAMHLTFLSSVWNDWEMLDLPYLADQLSLDGATAIPISRADFEKMGFACDQIEERVHRLRSPSRGMSPDWVDLGWSWLGSEASYSKFSTSGHTMQSRPKWDFLTKAQDIVLIGGVVETCRAFLNDRLIRSRFSVEKFAFLRTRVSCQLQEVDWWLLQFRDIVACEVCNLLNELASWQTENNVSNMSVNVSEQSSWKKRVRAVLVYRAVLLALLLWTALDTSPLRNTGLGKKIVLLR